MNIAFFLLTVTTLERLYTDLLNDYKNVRPVLDWNETVDVQVMFSLYQVKSLVCMTSRDVLEIWGK